MEVKFEGSNRESRNQNTAVGDHLARKEWGESKQPNSTLDSSQ
jgi:hypothetical protein